ncbi:MAG: type VI secretion system baseplate subunit TssF, partial [Cyclobacteriaceae bacterium]|nr:type VI secretion system baseplate subunit TssF [Cyclobacteriaceae bacterium]
MKESKEKIKSRMIKNASRLWGYQDTQSESSFDPFVGMIIGCLAGELEKVSEGIAATESRVVERLIELLTPEPITGPYSAHAIIRAIPTQPHFIIDSLHQFYGYKKKPIPGNHAKVEEKSIFFSPTASYKLFRGKVNFLATGKKLFEFQEEQYKEVYALAQSSMPLPPTDLWLGLEFDDELESLMGLSLFFDLRNEMYEEAFYNSLVKGRWSINGHPIQMTQGFNIEAETERTGLDTMIKQEMNVCAKICSHVNNLYQKKFLTLSGGGNTLEQLFWPEEYPRLFKDAFNQKDLDGLDRKLYWIKVELQEAFPADILEDVTCSMNCFPVINRRLNEFTQTSRDFINIIPLQTEDAFLDIKSVSNSEGNLYSLKSFSSAKGMEKGSYILRHGGVGRFDKRNAMEILNYLLELLRDESAAFSVLGTDMISSNLRELNQMIARLEQRL